MKNRLPVYFKQEIPGQTVFDKLQFISRFNLHTVCQEAKCPNINHCFTNQRLTFLILGDTCTRNCRFCAIKKSDRNHLGVDWEEPHRLASVVKELGLKYVVITSVTRDDLVSGGAEIFARTISLIRAINKEIKVEVLIPDFQGKISSLKTIIEANPDVVAHNIETVARLYTDLRPQANYHCSLEVLGKIKELGSWIITKSSLMLGLGETETEVINALEDLRKEHCDFLTLGQYLAPSVKHYPVKEFIGIEQFDKYRKIALALGFKSVLSGPLVRSSYIN
jgi:lipoic acid synthetase